MCADASVNYFGWHLDGSTQLTRTLGPRSRSGVINSTLQGERRPTFSPAALPRNETNTAKVLNMPLRAYSGRPQPPTRDESHLTETHGRPPPVRLTANRAIGCIQAQS